jgi:uncharacterized protein YlaI
MGEESQAIKNKPIKIALFLCHKRKNNWMVEIDRKTVGKKNFQILFFRNDKVMTRKNDAYRERSPALLCLHSF